LRCSTSCQLSWTSNKFKHLADFKGHSLQYLTTHHDLVRRQAESRQGRSKVAAGAKADGQPIKPTTNGAGDDFVSRRMALARG